ncbi:hypothetical protein SCOR_04480 [Sulfidibacter corallicola]|uniref:Uncharacterized protein n=1 Tax=Sulfidibacter corallicola TaxID=2818388 RepID=A0A8A4TSE7_SULCO|nr:hypothetical protein [Sulfidibacter corallicola]QTD51968.1 hypothetical protein J3U87_05800 [Sulfidibacter corallicola]
MDAISSAISGFHTAQYRLDVATTRLSEGHVLPEVVSAQDLAQKQIEVQVSQLKEALEAESRILDLLV